MPATPTDELQDSPTSGTRSGDHDEGRLAVIATMVAVLSVAAGVRLYGLGADSLWDNEILSLQRATAGPGDAYDLLRDGTHPPLYSQIVLRPVLWFGETEFLQRLPSAIFGVVTVALTYRFGARWFDRRVGVGAAALLAVLPLHVYYSREGRMYALLALLVTLWIASLLRAHRIDSVGAWTAYTLLGASVVYTHYYAGFTVIAVVGATAAVHLVTGVDATRRRRWFVSTGAIGLLFLPWLPTLVHQYRYSSAQLPGRPIRRLPATITQFFTGFVQVSTLVQWVIGAAIVALAVPVLAMLWRSMRDRDAMLLTWGVLVAAVVGTIGLATLVALVKPILFVRYFVGIVPVCCVLLAAGATRARSRMLGLGAYGVLVVVSVGAVVPILTDTWRPEFAAVAERIAREESDGAIVILIGRNEDDLGVAGFDHYRDPALPVVRIDPRGAAADVADTVARTAAERVWLVQYREVSPIEAPDGYGVAFSTRYDSRFFAARFPIRLTLLEPTG